MLRYLIAAIWAVSTFALLSVPVAAQTNAGGTVNCLGKAVLHSKPTVLRLRFSIMECGENLKAAIDNLDRRGEAYRKALLAAHAKANSIKIGAPTIHGELVIPRPVPESEISFAAPPATGTTVVPPQVQPESVQPQSNGAISPPVNPSGQTMLPKPTSLPPNPSPPSAKISTTGNVSVATAVAPPVPVFRPQTKVQAWLNADWDLKGETPAELLFEMEKIAKSVHDEMKEAMLKIGPTMFPPVHIPNFRQDYAMFDQSQDIDVPRYVFVAPISAEQLQKLRAEAFAQTKAEATRLAEAAGCRVGSIQSLSSSWNRSSWAPPGMLAGCAGIDAAGPTELIGSAPSILQSCELTVNATFRLLQPEEPVGTGQ